MTDTAGILACAKVQTVEFHGWGSKAGDPERPDRLVIDLDPGEHVTFASVKAAAQQVRRSLAEVGLDSFALLTGGKGIHVVVPITPAAEWPVVREFAKLFCTALAQAEPRRFTVALPKERRRGLIFLDFLRNQRTATAVMPYSVRARSRMPVAAPVSWEELDRIKRSDAFTIADTEQLVRRSNVASMVLWGVRASNAAAAKLTPAIASNADLTANGTHKWKVGVSRQNIGSPSAS